MTWITGYQKWLSETDSLNNAGMVFAHFAGSTGRKKVYQLCAGICVMNPVLTLTCMNMAMTGQRIGVMACPVDTTFEILGLGNGRRT